MRKQKVRRHIQSLKTPAHTHIIRSHTHTLRVYWRLLNHVDGFETNRLHVFVFSAPETTLLCDAASASGANVNTQNRHYFSTTGNTTAAATRTRGGAVQVSCRGHVCSPHWAALLSPNSTKSTLITRQGFHSRSPPPSFPSSAVLDSYSASRSSLFHTSSVTQTDVIWPSQYVSVLIWNQLVLSRMKLSILLLRGEKVLRSITPHIVC